MSSIQSTNILFNFKQSIKKSTKQSTKQTFLIFILVMLGACTSTNQVFNSDDILDDDLFPQAKYEVLETPEEIFALNDTIKKFVDSATQDHDSDKAKVRALINAIFDHAELDLNYDNVANTTASQTFGTGEANCLSLTIMTYAMTQHLGLDSRFQNVQIPEIWTRQSGNTLINKHINLAILPQNTYRNSFLVSRPMVVDFAPQQNAIKFRVDELTKEQITSHFYANRAAEMMMNENHARAYAYLKESLVFDPKNQNAWMNLGVLLSQHNYLLKAENAYRYALELNPRFSGATENLALLYKKTNRQEKAKDLEARLMAQRLDNPYYHSILGKIALEKGHGQAAIRHFSDALSLNSRPHEFHLQMASAYLMVGDTKRAKRYLTKAKRRAPGDYRTQQRYSSKLASLSNI